MVSDLSNYKTNQFEAGFVVGHEGMWMKSKEVNTAFNVFSRHSSKGAARTVASAQSDTR